MHPSVSLNLLCYPELPLQEAVEISVEDGFQQVGVAFTRLEEVGVERGVEIIRDSGLGLGTLSCGGMFTLADPSRWADERETIKTVLDVAAELGAQTSYGTAGPSGDLDWDDAAAAFAEAAREVIEYSRQVGVPLIIEQTNPLYADIDFVHTFRDSVALAEMTGIGVCVDLFPTWQERGLLDTARRGLESLKMVQLGDYCYGTRQIPNRAVPGDGVIPFHRIIGGILELGYRGPIDLELLGPRIEQEGARSAAVRSGRYMSELLETLATA